MSKTYTQVMQPSWSCKLVHKLLDENADPKYVDELKSLATKLYELSKMNQWITTPQIDEGEIAWFNKKKSISLWVNDGVMTLTNYTGNISHDVVTPTDDQILAALKFVHDKE